MKSFASNKSYKWYVFGPHYGLKNGHKKTVNINGFFSSSDKWMIKTYQNTLGYVHQT